MGNLNSELIILRKRETDKAFVSSILRHRFNSREPSLYTDHRFSLCRSSSSHMEIKKRRWIYCVQAQRVWGRGGERRKQARAVEEKTSVDRRSQTWSNSIQHYKVFRYSFSEAIPTASNTIRCFDTVFQRPYRYFSIALKVVFSSSDRYTNFHQ